MAAAQLKKFGAILALAILVFTFVVIPGGGGVVVADGMSGGFPYVPPPDTTTVTACPGENEDVWPEVTVFISTISSMIL